MVVFAMTTARLSAHLIPARLRIPSYAVWDFAVFVLNVLAFILVGLQLKAIVVRLDSPTRVAYAGIGAAVCAATVIARIVWVSATAAFRRWRCRQSPRGPVGPHDPGALSRGALVVVSWCGMRGIVTLAAALAIPTTRSDGSAFPCRDLVLFTAFSVVLGTLVLQGMTLRPLMNLLHLEDDGMVEREVRLARVERLRAALSTTLELPEDEISALMRHRYQLMLRRAEADFAESERGHLQDASGHHVMLSDSASILRAAMPPSGAGCSRYAPRAPSETPPFNASNRSSISKNSTYSSSPPTTILEVSV